MNLAALPQIHTKLILNLLFPFPSREIWSCGFWNGEDVALVLNKWTKFIYLSASGAIFCRRSLQKIALLLSRNCVKFPFPQIRPHFFYISICEEWKPPAFILHKYARIKLRSEAPQFDDFFVNLSCAAAQIHKKHRKDEDRRSSSLRYSLVYGQKIWARREAPTLRF